MKKILLLVTMFALMGCENNVSQSIATDKNGKVTINGKQCEVLWVSTGDRGVYFVDCGPGSSSVTYQSGKNQTTTVGQYTPPVASETPCPCRRTDDGRLDCPTPPCVKVIEPPCKVVEPAKAAEELKKIQEIKKEFYK